RNKSIGLGIELLYDSSRIRLEKITRTPWVDISTGEITSYYISHEKEDVKVGWVFNIYVIF
ncbi:MAG: hypothetical protein U9R24_05070, partial [Thermodesulfobacteriota bacterium]|nr:hypothetical protein [Thermodesulfobacteriota bacterium]